MKRLPVLCLVGLACLADAAAAAEGAALRDPMLPPRRAAATSAGTGAPAPEAQPLPEVRQILVIGTQRYVVDQGRLRRPGELLGGRRIERIEDAAVVVREGATLHRLTLFNGVAKQAAASAPDATAPERQQR